MTTQEKNEVIFSFMKGGQKYLGLDVWAYINPMELKFESDYNWLMAAWKKFRDLKFENDKCIFHHSIKMGPIRLSICNDSITEAFECLVSGIHWYNSVTEKQP